MKNNNIIILIAGSLAAFHLLTKKSAKSQSQSNIRKLEASEDSQDLEATPANPKSEPEPEPESEPNPENNPNVMGFVPNPMPSNPINPQQGLFIPNPTKPINGSQIGSLKGNKIPVPPPVQGSQLGELKYNEIPLNKIIIKSKPTPGYFYRPNATDNLYEDPLLKIAADAYGLVFVPNNVILTYAHQINKSPYNIRFQHVSSQNYSPYNKRVDTSKAYGSLKQQFNDSAQGALLANKNKLEYPVLWIPEEKDFF